MTTLATVNSNVGSFGDGTNVASFTVNAKGLVTAASNVAIASAPKWTTARTLSFTGDATGSGSVDGSASVATALTLATVNANVGSFGDATHIPTFTVNAKGLITAASQSAITVPTAANPSATIGLSAVNGVAATFMASDSAPALSQAIAPTWSAAHIFNVAGASGAPALKVNGAVFTGGGTTNTKPQVLIEPAGATTNNWNNSGTLFGINAASGFAGDYFNIQLNGVSKLKHDASAGIITSTAEIIVTNNASMGTTSSVPGVHIGSTGALTASSITNPDGTLDTFLTRRGAANWQLGTFDVASPVAQTLSTQGSRSGTDTNVGGGNLTIQAGRGTGNAAGATLSLQAPVPVASGTGAQTQTTGLQVLYGVAKLSSYTVAGLPAAATVGNGCRAFVTDSTLAYAGANIGTAVTGGGANGNPVITVGGAWVIG